VKHPRRWRRLLLSLTAILAVLLVLLHSETVLRLSVTLVSNLVKPLSVESVHGRLAGPFTLRGIAYTDAGTQLSLEALTVDWRPSRLLLFTAHVTAIHAKGLKVTRQPAPDEVAAETATEPFTLPRIGFPLKMVLEHATVEGITLNLTGQGEPLTVTQLLLQAETELNTLRLHTLQLRSEWLAFTIDGTIRPRQDYRIDLAMTWSVPQQEVGPWTGAGTLRGNLEELQLQQRLAAPFAASLSVTARHLLKELAWQGSLAVPQLDSTLLPFAVSPAFVLDAELEAQGGIDAFTSSATFAGHVERVGDVEGSLDAAFAEQRLELTRLLLTRKQDAARIEASGELELATPLRYRMEADWQALSWPQAVASVTSRSGAVAFSGEAANYNFESEFQLGGEQIPDGRWRLQGSGDSEAVTLRTFEGALLDGHISGEATIGLAPPLNWQARLDGKALNPGVKWPQWPGRLAFASSTKGALAEQGLELAITLPTLSGELRGRRLQGRGEAGVAGDVVSLQRLEVQLGSAKMHASGRMAEELAFVWELTVRELADLLPEASGSLAASGRIDGALATPRLTLQLQGSGPQLLGYQAREVEAEVSLDLQQSAPSKVRLRLEQLHLPGFPSQSVTLEADGPLNEHRIRLDSRGSGQTLGLGIAAGYTDGQWAGALERLRLDNDRLGQWQLTEAAPFSLMADSMRLEQFCLVHDEARLCSSGHWSRLSGFEANLQSSGFPLQLLRPYLPQRFTVKGELDGRARVAQTKARPPELDLDLHLGEGAFELLDPDSGKAALSLPYAAAAATLRTSDAGELQGEVSLAFGKEDTLSLTVQTSLAEGWPLAPLDHPLNARLRVALRELGFIAPLIPEVENLHGLLDVDISLAGSVNAPRLSGHAKVDEGRLEIPRMGLSITALQLATSGDNSRQLDISGQARSGDGELRLDGRLMPAPKGIWALELALAGKDFEVARIPEARMQISPDLRLQLVGREIRLEGDLDIPSARLEPRDISSAVRTSNDVVIVGEEPAAEAEGWRITTRVRITAADSIRFIGYGFDGRIGGNLLLVDEPGSVTRGRGELHVVPGSTYRAFGRNLTTSRGQLTFADSPVDNPNLDITAARTIGDVVAGVHVRGTAKNPLLTLYSEPAMDQADILAYLTLGHPMNVAGQGESEELFSAANTAGLIGGNYLAGYVGRQFGLEEVRVEAESATASPWVVVGKYLSPRLYVRYGVGVYEDAYSIIVRYQLTEHWQLQGEGGQFSGADILYTFERP
jgi:translocation and assembly module TamB